MKVNEITNFNLFNFLYGDSNDFQEITNLLKIQDTELGYLDKIYSKRYSRLKNVCSYYAEMNSNELAEMLSYELELLYVGNWLKVTKAFMSDYNPIENYSMEEIRTPNLVDTTEGTATKVDSNSMDSTTNGSQSSTTTIVDNNEVINQVYPFNSNDSKATDKQLVNNDSDSTLTNSIQNTDKTIQNNNSNSTQNQTLKHTGTETLKRTGNIGVTTSQQMLESEFELRKHNIIKMIFDDIDSVLCTNYYN